MRLNATMNQNVVTYTVVVDTDNSDETLMPYGTATIEFDAGRHDNVLMVPNAALQWRPVGAQLAFVAPDSPRLRSAQGRTSKSAHGGGAAVAGDREARQRQTGSRHGLGVRRPMAAAGAMSKSASPTR